MFTGRLRSEIPPALVSERGHCSRARNPLGQFPGLFLTPPFWTLRYVLWVTEMLKWKPGKHSICPVC